MKIGCHWDLTPAQTSLRNFLPLSTALTPYESPRLPSQFPTAVLFLFTSPLWFQSSVLTWLTCEKVSNWSSCSAVCLFVVVVVVVVFWLHYVACGIFIPQPGIEPTPLTVEARILNHWIGGKAPLPLVLMFSKPFSILPCSDFHGHDYVMPTKLPESYFFQDKILFILDIIQGPPVIQSAKTNRGNIFPIPWYVFSHFYLNFLPKPSFSFLQ